MKGFLFDIEFTWGFQSRIVGMSKTSPSYSFPPPTTILGALAESYSKSRNLSESRGVQTMIELSREILAFGYRSLNAVPVSFQDINRVLALGSRGGISYPSTRDVYGSFDAPAKGKTLLSSVDDNPPRLRSMIVFSDETDVNAEDIWKIRRIGTKESLVSIIDVVEKTPEVVKDTVKTNYSLPIVDNEIKIEDKGGFFIDLYFVPLIRNPLADAPSRLYLESKVIKYKIAIPYRDYYIKVRLPSGYVGYKIDQEVVVGIES